MESRQPSRESPHWLDRNRLGSLGMFMYFATAALILGFRR